MEASPNDSFLLTCFGMVDLTTGCLVPRCLQTGAIGDGMRLCSLSESGEFSGLNHGKALESESALLNCLSGWSSNFMVVVISGMAADAS